MRPGDARQGRDGALLPARGPDRHRPQHEARRERELQRDLHVPRGRRHRVREGDRERGAHRGHRARRGARRRSTSSARWRARRAARSASSASCRARRSIASPPCAGSSTTRSTWAYNKVLVFNLGFDAKGQRGVHWCYYPSRETVVLPRRLVRQHLRRRPDEPLRRDRLPEGRRHRRARHARAGARRPRARGGGDRPAARRRALGRARPGLRPHHARIAGRAQAPHGAAARAGRLVDRPLRRLDVLRHRGQHRRGARPRRELEFEALFV